MSMKRNRSLNFSEYYVSKGHGDEDVETYEQEQEDQVPSLRPAKKSTLFDFVAGEIPQKAKEAEKQEEEEEYPEEEFGFEEEEEEDYDDKQILDDFFKKIAQTYEYSHANLQQMKHTVRMLDYSYPAFIKLALAGKFGPFSVKKSKEHLQSKTPAIPKPQSSSIQRAQSSMNLNKITPKQHKECHRTPQMVASTLSQAKKHINLVIVGHVDAGKSTTIGHILVLNGDVTHGELSRIKNESKAIGKEEDQFAWVMAEDSTERQRGVTIDVAMTKFETPHLNITVLDAPGHKDFVPNMIAGASLADAALLVVDVASPLLEAGQAREHVLLCRALGVSSCIVAINKMDSVLFEQSAFEDLKESLTTFLKGFGYESITFVPTAASLGDNLASLSPNMPWYKGPTVIQAIDALKPPTYSIDSEFCMCLTETIDTGNREVTVTGKIESGYVCQFDTVKVLPADQIARVSSVKIIGETVPFASAGVVASITLSTPLSSDTISPGSAVVSPDTLIPIAEEFAARIVTVQMETPLLKGTPLMFHRHAADIPVKIVKINSIINRKTKAVERQNPGFVPQNSSADIVFRLEQPLCLQVHTKSKSFGRFILRTKGCTIGFGQVTDIVPIEKKE